VNDATPRRRLNVPLLALAMLVTVAGNIPLGAVAVTYVLRGQDRRAVTWIVAAALAGLVTAAIVLALRS
jgi:hypothetical protein